MPRGKRKETKPVSDSVQPKKLTECKTGCKRKSRTEGFCANCYAKYLKGHFLKNGEKHPTVVARERALEIKRQKRQLRVSARQREADKAEIAEGLSSNNLLKVLQNEHPETKQSKYCKHLEFFTCDAVCYSRLFTLKRPECEKCKDHDHKFDFLKQFIKEHSNEKATDARDRPTEASALSGSGQADATGREGQR